MKMANILTLVGNTPVVLYETLHNCPIYLKLEMYNPSGSIKDRIALKMVEMALAENPQIKGIVEATSGNTGIGLSFVCSSKKIPLVIFMPENMSKERLSLMAAYGTKIILTEATQGMSGAIREAKRFAQENNFLYIDQFNNPANILAHKENTAEEIFSVFPNLDVLVAGIGTGGTIMGLSQGLKGRIPNLQFIGVEPSESPVISGGKSGSHRIQGIGAGFIPPLLDKTVLTGIQQISSTAAEEFATRLAKEGFFLGISSAAAILAAKKIAEDSKQKKTILVICPDSGIKYLSTEIYDEK